MKLNSILFKLPKILTDILLLYLCLFLVFFIISLFTGEGPKSTNSTQNYDEQSTAKVIDSPNVVSTGLQNATHELGNSLQSMSEQAGVTGSYILSTAGNVAVTILTQSANTITTAFKLTAGAIYNGVSFVASTVKLVATFIIDINIKTFSYVFGPPVRVFASVFTDPVITRYVTPSEYISDIPIIDPNSPELKLALEAIAAENSTNADVQSVNTQVSKKVRWPLQGRITTQFGVPHWPYQPTHTGLDISDSTASGVTPIYPFKAGTVVKTVNTNAGLGNHVVVDHGGGLTSVYAHLDSITATEGQVLDINTALGRQGTTGVSTGVHLHFEIRINGQATNPLPFLES